MGGNSLINETTINRSLNLLIIPHINHWSMADPAARRDSGNRTQMHEELDSMAELMWILETTLFQYDKESLQRIGDELLNCVTILKYQFDKFAFRLKSLLPAQPISMGFEDVMQREVHNLIQCVNILDRAVEYPLRRVRQQRFVNKGKSDSWHSHYNVFV